MLRSLSHPTRLKILCRLMDSESSVNELTDLCKISQATMSQFLSRMKAEGILDCRRESQFVYYSIKDKRVILLMQAMHEIFSAT